MGIFFSRVLNILIGPKDKRILMLGLDASGKTTVLYKLHLGDTVHTIPTVGFNVEQVDYKNLHMTIWDVGGQTKIRQLWKHYYQNSDALIFIVDSNDRERIDEARDELHKVLSDELLFGIPVLVLANKQDLLNAVSCSEMTDMMGMHNLRRLWYVQACSATSGEGLYSGIDWLSTQLNVKN